MIRVSDQAFISKWWCSGAMRRTRRPSPLEGDHLEDHRERLDQEDPADQEQQHLGLRHDRERGERAAEPHRAGVAHEDLSREGVVPEEPDRGPDQAGAEDGEVEILGIGASVRRTLTR